MSIPHFAAPLPHFATSVSHVGEMILSVATWRALVCRRDIGITRTPTMAALKECRSVCDKPIRATLGPADDVPLIYRSDIPRKRRPARCWTQSVADTGAVENSRLYRKPAVGLTEFRGGLSIDWTGVCAQEHLYARAGEAEQHRRTVVSANDTFSESEIKVFVIFASATEMPDLLGDVCPLAATIS